MGHGNIDVKHVHGMWQWALADWGEHSFQKFALGWLPSQCLNDQGMNPMQVLTAKG